MANDIYTLEFKKYYSAKIDVNKFLDKHDLREEFESALLEIKEEDRDYYKPRLLTEYLDDIDDTPENFGGVSEIECVACEAEVY